jgi:hypothetical protein
LTFSPFDWPYTINKILVTAGEINQSTGEWVPESTVPTAISGHVSDLTVKIQIYEDSTISAEWLIESKLNASGVLNRHAGINRNTYLLKRRT